MEIRSLAAGTGEIVQLLKSRCSRNTKYKSVRCMLFLAAHLLHLLVSQLHFFFFLLMAAFRILKVYWCIYHLCSLWQGFIHTSFITLWRPHFTRVCSQISVKIFNCSAEICQEKLNCNFIRAQNKSIPLFKHTPMSIFKYEGEGKLLAHFPLLNTMLQGHYLKSEKYLQNFLPFA